MPYDAQGNPPQQGVIWPKVSTVLWLRNPGLRIVRVLKVIWHSSSLLLFQIYTQLIWFHFVFCYYGRRKKNYTFRKVFHPTFSPLFFPSPSITILSCWWCTFHSFFWKGTVSNLHKILLFLLVYLLDRFQSGMCCVHFGHWTFNFALLKYIFKVLFLNTSVKKATCRTAL